MTSAIFLTAVAATAAFYARGVHRLWERAGVGRVTRPWRVAAFATGLITLAVAGAGPLDHLAGERLWAHMVQHVLLLAVVAPLLVLGNPVPTLLWGLAPATRERASGWSRRVSRGHATVKGWLTWVALALALQSAAMWVWHAPGPYQAAVRSPWLHGLEHLSFLTAALLFWWAVLGARRRSLYGPGVIAIFLAAVQGTLLGAFMTLAGAPWYPVYAARADAGVSPLQDQQLAGVIMWGPGGALYLLAAVLLFAAWLGQSERARPLPGLLAGGATAGR